jgi:NADH-quinone oxidoreductase subunit L
MHGMGDETDIRKMGGLARKMPMTALTFGISTLAITGFVPLSGFWSKDAILGNALFSHNHAWPAVGTIAYALGTTAALGTAFYMSRLFFLTFVGKPRTHAAEHAHESSPVMTIPLLVLALLAIVAVWLALPLHDPGPRFQQFTASVFGAGTQRLLDVGHFHAGAHPAWPYFAAWAVAALGTVVAWLMYAGAAITLPARLAAAFPRLYQFAYDKFRVDELYEHVILQPVRSTAYVLWRVVDVLIIDGLFVNGIARFVGMLGGVLRLAQNGDVQRYAAIMAMAAAVILWTVLGGGNSP